MERGRGQGGGGGGGVVVGGGAGGITSYLISVVFLSLILPFPFPRCLCKSPKMFCMLFCLTVDMMTALPRALNKDKCLITYGDQMGCVSILIFPTIWRSFR